MHNFTRIGTFGLLALVALRVGIGWHFFKEGTDKVRSGNFSSEGFLKSAQGRMAGFYHGMVWDYDGKIRLNGELMKAEIEKAVSSASKHYGFNQQQIDSLNATKKQLLSKLDDLYKEENEAIVKLMKGTERVAKMEQSDTWNEISSLRSQKDSIEKDRLTGIAPALKRVDELWDQLQAEITREASPEQRKAAGRYYLKRPREGLVSSAVINRIIPVFDLTVGALLILGLFVPLAGWAGALFLFSVILSQFPGDPNTQPTYYQAIEALALVVLATIGAGKFGGLDFFIWARRNRAKPQPA
jgi:uncharacterized membrane protein YphA (DoxX/SURF4 family)